MPTKSAAAGRPDAAGGREQLVTTAIRLFAERGVHGVSLRALGEAAGQRNTAAVHYHFGDRAGVLDATLERVLAAVREPVSYAQARAFGLDLKEAAPPLHRAVHYAFLPILTLSLRYPEWGSAGVRLLSRAILGETASLSQEFEDKTAADTARLVRMFAPLLPHVPEPLLKDRLDFATVSVVCGCAASAYVQVVSSDASALGLAGPLLDYVAGGLAAPVR